MADHISVSLAIGRTKQLLVELCQIHHVCIKTHDSESPGQEEAAIIHKTKTKITRPLSELFTRKTAKKIANPVAKLP